MKQTCYETSAKAGPWDAQRIGGKYNAKYRDYATVAIGLYAAAAGIPEREILIIQNMYAWTSSRFGDEARDKTYTHLLQRNVENTNLGYTMFRTFLSGDQQLSR